jgi:hypothetical protein
MPTKRVLIKYCRIFQWVEAKDEDFAGAIRDLCKEGALSGGRSGATFLFPTAAVRKEIVKKAYTTEAEEAITLLDAHIISDSVRTSADFKRGVGSRLRIKLEVEAASGDTVTLTGGAKLKVAADFRPLNKDNIAVWEVVSGEVPTTGPEFVPPKVTRGGRPGKEHHRAHAAYSGGTALNSRQVLAANVESEYNNCMRADRCRTKDPYLAHTVSMLNFLKGKRPELLVMVLPIIDRDPAVTFYLLVEPYKTSGSDFVLPDEVLFGDSGWNGASIYEGAVSEFEGYFGSLSAQGAPSAEDRSSGDPVVPYVYRDAGYIRSAIDNVRLQIVGADGHNANKVTTPKLVHQVYESLIAQNAIGGAQPILPDDTIRLLPGSKKLWQDELRFMLHAALQTLRKEAAYNEGSFAEIVRMLRFSRPGNNYSAEASLSNVELLQSNVAPQAEFEMLLKFINSTDFLYIPVTDEKVGGDWGDIPTTPTMYDRRDLSVYNTEASKRSLLAGYRAAGMDAPRPLDAGTIASIRHYVSIHGALPPGLGIVEAVAMPQGR